MPNLLTQRRILRPFSPDQNPGLALWLDAADASTIAISTGVSEWRDKGPDRLVGVQASGSKQPSYSSSNQINGINIVDFDGTDDCIQVPSFTLPVDITVFAVYDQDNASSKPLFVEHSANAGTNNGFWVSGITPSVVARRSPNTNSYAPSPLSGVQGTSSRVLTSVTDRSAATNGAIHRMRVNGSELVMVAAGSNTGTTVAESNVTDTLNIGSRNDGASVQFDGGLAEFLIYRGVLSAGQITSVEAYLKAKWGTP